MRLGDRRFFRGMKDVGTWEPHPKNLLKVDLKEPKLKPGAQGKHIMQRNDLLGFASQLKLTSGRLIGACRREVACL